MSAFSQAFNLLKADHFANLYGEEFVLNALVKAMPGDPNIEAMRNFVLANSESQDPQMQAEVEKVYQYLTALMSGRQAEMPQVRGYQEGGRGIGGAQKPAAQGPTPASFPKPQSPDMQAMGFPMQMALAYLGL